MKFLKFYILGVCIATSLPLWAQYSVKGKITDQKTQNPLTGALVYIPSLKVGVSTDQEGRYQLENLKIGDYYLEISLIGYKSITQKVFIYKDSLLNFSLSTSVTELNEVVVTGVTRSTQLKQSPVIISSLDKNHFQQNTATNLIDGLKNLPGVSQITTGSSISKPVIRGLGYNRVITLNNGIRQEGQQWGDEHGVEIDENAVERIEIIKGPGSLMYGSDGIAGVINFLAPKPVADGTVKTRISTNYQTNNQMAGTSFSNMGNKGGIQWQTLLSGKIAGNYQNHADGKVLNSGSKEWDGKLFAGMNKSWGYSHLTLSSYNSHLGITEGERDEKGNFLFIDQTGEEVSATAQDLKGYAIGFPRQKINHLSLASNNYILLDKGDLTSTLGFQQNRRREYENPLEPDEEELYMKLGTFTYNIRYNLEKRKGWETSVGIGGMIQTNKNAGEEYLIPDYTFWDGGIYLFSQKEFGKFTFAGGIRWDNRHIHSAELHSDGSVHHFNPSEENTGLKFMAIQKNINNFSGSLGFSYPINKESTLKFNLSRGFRAPNIAELASNGKHEGTFRYEIGNSDLNPEISHQVDLAYYLDAEHVSLEVSPFINHIHNFIFLKKLKDSNGNDIFPLPEEKTAAYQFVSGNALLKGAEVYVDFHPHPLDWLHIANSFSFVLGNLENQADSMRNIPMIPAPKYRAEIKVQWSKITTSVLTPFIKAGLDHYFSQNRIFNAYDTETPTPAYTLLGGGLGTTIAIGENKEALNLFIQGENLTNRVYQNHLSRLKYAPENPLTGRQGIFNMGRNISLKLIANI